MTGSTQFAPARPGMKIPMPDRGNRLMAETGESVDLASPYYRRLVDGGDIVEVKIKQPPAGKSGGKTIK